MSCVHWEMNWVDDWKGSYRERLILLPSLATTFSGFNEPKQQSFSSSFWRPFLWMYMSSMLLICAYCICPPFLSSLNFADARVYCLPSYEVWQSTKNKIRPMRLVAIVVFIKSMFPYICHRLLRDCVIQGFLNTINSAIEFLTKERYLFLFLEADYLDVFTVETIIAS